MDIGNWQSADVQANGLKLHYYRTGTNSAKPVIVLLHGITDNGLCWAPLARALEDDYDLVMPDARGHGLSDDATGYAPQSHAADAAALITALGLDRPVIMGHSMGGGTATLVAARHGDLVRAAILEDPAWARAETPEQQQARPAFMAEWRRRLVAQQALTPEDMLAQGRLDNPGWSEAELEPWVEAKRQVRATVLDYVQAERPEWSELVSRITVPGLLITGDIQKGVIISPEWAAEAVALWPKLQVANVPNAGHNIRRDGFAAYIKAVRIFLAQI